MKNIGKFIIGIFFFVAGLYLLEDFIVKFFKIVLGIVLIFVGLGFILGGRNARFYTKVYK